MYTLFMDMRTGGYYKTRWHYIYIKGDEKAAVARFKARFNRDPHENTTCNCCGPDYDVSPAESIDPDRTPFVVITRDAWPATTDD